MQENKVRISEIFNSRLDPHFYRKEFLKLRNSLDDSKTYRLGDIVEFSNETWDQKSKFEDEFPYIEISEIDIRTGIIQNINWCSLAKAPSRAKMVVHTGDIIISTTRPNRGAISVIPTKFDGYIASTGFSVIRSIKINNLNKEYLYEYLRTSISLRQMLRHSSGGNYPAITQEELKKILIYVPDASIQIKIVKLLSEARIGLQKKINKAANLITSISDILLEELKIKIPDKNSEKVYKTSIENLFNNRIDVEYHQPKYEELEQMLINNPNCTNLSKAFDSNGLVKGYLPKDNERDGNIKYLQIKNVLQDGYIDIQNFAHANNGIYKNSQKLNKNDIIIVATGATIGKVGLWNDENGCYLGGDMFKFQVNKDFYPYYILAYLLSPLGQLQIKRNITGATNGHLSPIDIENLKIIKLSKELQKELSEEYKERLKQAKELRKQADIEFDSVKEKVERIILGKESL